MKILLLTSLLFLINPQLKAEGNNLMHERCLQAADYEGCMDFQSGVNKSTTTKSNIDCSSQICSPNQVKQSTDNLGMKIIKGWFFKENPASRSARYWDNKIYKVNSAGETGRFFHQRMVLRYFQKGSSGTSGYFSSSGSGSINCTDSLYGSMNCTTTAPSSTYIPGMPGIPERVVQTRIDVIYDCKDETAAMYIDNKIDRFKGLDGKKRKWHSWDNLPKTIRFSWGTLDESKDLLKNNICKNIGIKEGFIKNSDLDVYYREKGIRKRGSSNKKNVGNINCNSPVWKNKPICN